MEVFKGCVQMYWTICKIFIMIIACLTIILYSSCCNVINIIKLIHVTNYNYLTILLFADRQVNIIGKFTT